MLRFISLFFLCVFGLFACQHSPESLSEQTPNLQNKSSMKESVQSIIEQVEGNKQSSLLPEIQNEPGTHRSLK